MDPVKTKSLLNNFQANPNLFFKEALGATPEIYQEHVNDAIAKYSRVAISACHDVGKSWDLARIVLWFGTCFPYCKIITTAPTYLQVKSILWSEIRSGHANAKYSLGGTLNQTEWQLSTNGDWFAIGLTPKNEVVGGEGQGKQSSFQGWHAPYILIIFDEATGIPHNVWTMAEGLMTSANVKFVAIGNPTSRNSDFFRCFQDPSWHKIKLSCFDSPNLIANGLTSLEALTNELDVLRTLSDKEVATRFESYKIIKPWLLSPVWVMGRALKWGISHPLFVSKVLGKFPEEGDNTLIPLGVCEDARLRVAYPTLAQRKTLGIDVARFGTDSTVFTYLHGDKFIDKKVFVKRDTMAISGEAIAFCKEKGWPDIIVVDGTGLGSGVVDALREAFNARIIPNTTDIREVQFGAAPICKLQFCRHTKDCDKAKYTNLKGRMFDLLGQDLRRGLSLPDDDVYVDELPTILYAYDSKGRMVIESKDDYKKRTGRNSPDHADSLALANYGRYDESNVGLFGDTDDAPGTSAARFKGDAW